MNTEQTQVWFKVADEDKDGVIGGQEAVRFFKRSGLAQDVLGQIWEYASGGASSLNLFQFTTAIRLTSLAQSNGGRLPPDQARMVAIGTSGQQLPPPKMVGLEKTGYSPQNTGVSYAPQTTGLPYQPQPAGSAYPTQVTGATYSTQMTGMQYASQPTGAVARPYLPQGTGAMPAYGVQMTGSQAPGYGSPGGYPPASPQEVQSYTATFMALDTDRDGVVKGSDCFGAFMQSGLDKNILKSIWDVVAGNAGQLNQDQFIRCQYLMSCAKRGMPVPSQLPPGPFPTVAAGPGVAGIQVSSDGAPGTTWSMKSQFGDQGLTQAVNAAYASGTQVPLPSLPGRKDFIPEQKPTYDSRLPGIDANMMGTLRVDERERLERERKAAAEKEQKLFAYQADLEAAKKRTEFYTNALQEVTVFKSRTDVALLQAQEQANRAQLEAEQLDKKYQQAYAGAEEIHAKGQRIREHIERMLQAKSDAEIKLNSLQQSIQMIESTSPLQVKQLEEESERLQQQVVAAEARKALLEVQNDGLRRQRDLLQQRLRDLQLNEEAAKAELENCKGVVSNLTEEVETARNGQDNSAVQQLLVKAAGAYRSLYAYTQTRGLELPFEAQLNNLGGFVWDDTLMAGVLDWVEDDEGSRGFVVVNALPDMESALAAARAKIPEDVPLTIRSKDDQTKTPAAPQSQANGLPPLPPPQPARAPRFSEDLFAPAFLPTTELRSPTEPAPASVPLASPQAVVEKKAAMKSPSKNEFEDNMFEDTSPFDVVPVTTTPPVTSVPAAKTLANNPPAIEDDAFAEAPPAPKTQSATGFDDNAF